MIALCNIYGHPRHFWDYRCEVIYCNVERDRIIHYFLNVFLCTFSNLADLILLVVVVYNLDCFVRGCLALSQNVVVYYDDHTLPAFGL